MSKRRAAVMAAAFAAGLLGAWYCWNLPQAVYMRGKLQASRRRPGQVGGLMLYRVPATFHRQEHSLSCEIAALKMALGAQGVDVSESELISKLSFDPTPRTGTIWGDPQKGFVGDIDGKMGKDGYGVYAEPIAAVARNYLHSEVLKDPTEQQLVEHMQAGRAVVVWGYFGQGRQLFWNTPDGRPIAAINGEHARTLIGYVGTDSTPDGFMLLDPIYGELYWSHEEFMKNWNAMDRMAVVVYGAAAPEPAGGNFEIR